MSSPTDQWLRRIWQEYPDLPKKLTASIEKEKIPKLSGWLQRVEETREEYEEHGEEVLSSHVQTLDGGRQVLPVYEHLEDMSEREVQAWQELFSCSARIMARHVNNYWEAHKKDLRLKIEDVLNQTPVVFLIVLSRYDPDHLAGEDDRDWSGAEEKGKVRFSTWLQRDVRRHIKEYLQKCSGNITQGPEYLQRLRDEILKFRDETYVEEGRYPTTEKIMEEVSQYYYADSISKEKLRSHVCKLNSASSPGMTSLDEPVAGNADDDRTVQEQLPAKSIGESELDAKSYFEQRIEAPAKLRACTKLITGGQSLTFEERRSLF